MQRVMARSLPGGAGKFSDQEAVSDELAALELQKLQRQYRIMEGDRKAYSEESRLLITKQRASIDKLKRDNEYLHGQLKLLEQRAEDRKKNGILSKKAEEMAEHAETFQRKVRTIAVEVASLDAHTMNLTRTIDSHRTMLGGVNAAAQNSESTAKQIRVLENRLDKSLIKFNNALAVNRKLRSLIDNLRRERSVFDGIYRRLEKELSDQKRIMAEVVEVSNSAYEARDDAQTRIIALREKSEKELQIYIQERKDLERALVQEKRLKEFITAKFSIRTLEQAEVTTSHRNPRSTSANRLQSTDLLAESSLNAYETAFAEIQNVTGIKDITGELVTHFKSIEDENFSLFNYVNEVNNEIEAISTEIEAYTVKSASLKMQLSKSEETRKFELAALEAELKSHTDRISAYESQYKAVISLFNDIRSGAQQILSALRLSLPTQSQTIAAPTGEQSSDQDQVTGLNQSETIAMSPLKDFAKEADLILLNGGVTDSTLITALALIEQRTYELLHINSVMSKGSHRASNTQPVATDSDAPAGPAVASSSASSHKPIKLVYGGPAAVVGRLEIHPPTGDDDDDDEGEDRPLTEGEIRVRAVEKGLAMKQMDLPTHTKTVKRRKRNA